MRRLAVLCDIVGRYGGTERYWETVLPELARSYDVRLFARSVEDPERYGVGAREIPWSDENTRPSPEAAKTVRAALEAFDPQAVITANVFDSEVLSAIREIAPRWIARIHDYRTICPNANKIFPQFPAVCTERMGAACVVNSFVRGCVQGPRPESIRRIRDRVAVRDALVRADATLISSKYVMQTCLQNGMRRSSLHLTPPPLQHDAYVDAVRTPASNTVLFAGRISPQKGLRSLIRAIGRIEPEKRPHLLVAGNGESEITVSQALARECGVRVTWRGWLSSAQLRTAIDDSKIVALPSLWPEPFGLVGTEAQARGRPAVAYDVGGVREWIDGAGIAVPRGDEAGLASAIVQLTGDAQTWSTYAAAARERAEQYRLQHHMALLRDIINGHPTKGARN